VLKRHKTEVLKIDELLSVMLRSLKAAEKKETDTFTRAATLDTAKNKANAKESGLAAETVKVDQLKDDLSRAKGAVDALKTSQAQDRESDTASLNGTAQLCSFFVFFPYFQTLLFWFFFYFQR